MKSVTDEAEETALMLINSSSKSTVVRSVTLLAEDSDNPCDIDDPQTIRDPNDVDQIEIAALPQTQPKSFTRIEDPAITEKRLRAKRQHATYVRWIEKMTREQKEALRQWKL